MALADLYPVLSGGGAVLILIYELYAPRILGIDTALGGLVDLPDKVDDVKSEQQGLKEDIEDVREDVEAISAQNEVSMQVQRAQARANDQMDHERVDQYLLKNGVDVDEFLRSNEMQGHENWMDTSDEE
jgi:outer membrane murein-binding lipoprotein Lpp